MDQSGFYLSMGKPLLQKVSADRWLKKLMLSPAIIVTYFSICPYVYVSRWSKHVKQRDCWDRAAVHKRPMLHSERLRARCCPGLVIKDSLGQTSDSVRNLDRPFRNVTAATTRVCLTANKNAALIHVISAPNPNKQRGLAC